MSTAWSVYVSLSTKLLSPFTDVASGAILFLAPAMRALVIAGMTIQVMWLGFDYIRGKGGQNAFMEAFFKILRGGLVVVIGLNLYSMYVVGILDEIFATLGTLFNPVAGSGIGGTAAMFIELDKAVNVAFDTFKDIYTIGMDSDHFSILPRANFAGPWMIFCAGLMMVGFFIYTLTAFYNLLFIKLCLIFLYSIGPFFIACFAFDSVSKWFDTWLSAVIRYGFTAVIITMVTGMANTLMTAFANDMAATSLGAMDYFLLGGKALIGMFILAKFTLKVPELAGALAGGLGITIAGGVSGGTPIPTALDYFKNRSASKAAAATETRVEQRHQELLKASGGGGGGGTNSQKAPNQMLAGISKGIGTMMAGAGAGVGAAAAGIGEGVGHLATKSAHGLTSMIGKGTGSITGSNKRPPSASIQRMNK